VLRIKWETSRRVTVALIAGLAIATAPSASEAATISRDQLEQMFAQIRSTSGWDLSRPLLWGYFFLDGDRAALERAAGLLAERGYRPVGIERVGKGRRAVWKLHVERVEVHTVDTLDQRNSDLNAFAMAQGLGSYDGMDVGPAS